jgi:hypothetical protein
VSEHQAVSIMLRDEGLVGGHYRIGVFIGRTPGARGKSGQIIVREDEWREIVRILEHGPSSMPYIGPLKVEIGASLDEAREAFERATGLKPVRDL